MIVDCESSNEASALDETDSDVEDELSGVMGVADGKVSEGGFATHRTIDVEALNPNLFYAMQFSSCISVRS